jgi:deoxyribonuclease-4
MNFQVKALNKDVYGYHVSYSKGMSLLDAFSDLFRTEMSCLQFFNGNRQSYARGTFSEEILTRFTQVIRRIDCKIFTHAPYSLQLTKANNYEVVTSLVNELKNAPFIQGTVVHLGTLSHTDGDLEKAIDNVANNIGYVYDQYGYDSSHRIIIENSAGEGMKLGSNLDEIESIYLKTGRKVGICIDTQHMFAAGEFKLSTTDGMNDLLRELESRFGSDLTLFHLNDSKVKFGERKDSHECLTQGKIWGKSTKSLEILVNFCRKRNIPLILETSDPSNDFSVLRKIRRE